MRTEECVCGKDVIASVTGRERFPSKNKGTEMTGYPFFFMLSQPLDETE